MSYTKKQGNKRMPAQRAKPVTPSISIWRYNAVWLLFCIAFILMFGRAVYLQVIDKEYLQSQGDARYLRIQKDLPNRGMIVDRHSQPLAISTPVNSIWVQPKTIYQQREQYSYQQLTKLLGISRDDLLNRVKDKQNREFVYLKRQVPPQLANEILALNVPGINSEREFKRYYPAGPVTSHVLGFTNIDNVGQEGLELTFNKQLKGSAGKTRVLRDKRGHVVDYVEQISPVQHGDDVQLSLDLRIQYLAYRYLQAAVKKHQAASATLVALDVKTGEVLAMVSAPDFNPNDRSDLKGSRFRNRAITDVFEPGSTLKPLSIGMVLDSGVASDQIVDTDPGYYYIGNSKITDTSNHGEMSVKEVIQHSSNIGTAKLVMQTPAKRLYQTYADFGFGQSNDLGLPGEQKGLLTKRKKWRPIEHATLSYGYGVSVNTLQLARAYQALANNGVLLPVSIHPVVQSPKGERVLSEQTAKTLHVMMESVVSDEGTAPLADVPGYRVAGKTGTVHKHVNGGYSNDNYLSLFAGFAPVSDPEIAIAVIVNDPQGDDYYGGKVAGPVFAKVMEGALRYRNIVPDALAINEKDSEPLHLMISRPQDTVQHSEKGEG